MNIAIIGATGFIGQKLLDEAVLRGHFVTAIIRDISRLVPQPGLSIVKGDTHQVVELAQALQPNDVVIVSVRWSDNNVEDVLEAVRKANVPRVIFVVGAGSLSMPDGRLWFDHMADQGILPPTSKSALDAYRRLLDEDAVNWTAFSPAADIEPGLRTGVFRVGRDELITDADGLSRISSEDFAVAVLNEIEKPTVSRARMTAGY